MLRQTMHCGEADSEPFVHSTNFRSVVLNSAAQMSQEASQEAPQ